MERRRHRPRHHRGQDAGGRTLSPVTPWPDLSKLTRSDAQAIAAYLKSLPPLHNQVPVPFKADEKPTVFVMTVLPAQVYAGMPKPPK